MNSTAGSSTPTPLIQNPFFILTKGRIGQIMAITAEIKIPDKDSVIETLSIRRIYPDDKENRQDVWAIFKPKAGEIEKFEKIFEILGLDKSLHFENGALMEGHAKGGTEWFVPIGNTAEQTYDLFSMIFVQRVSSELLILNDKTSNAVVEAVINCCDKQTEWNQFFHMMRETAAKFASTFAQKGK